MNRPGTIRGQRDIALQKMRLAALDRAGIDPRQVGRVFNRTATAPGQQDPERVTIPTNQSELEEMLGDTKKMQAVFGGKNGEFGEFIRNYARNIHAKDLSIATQVREQVDSVLANMLRDGEVDGASYDRPNLTAAQVMKQNTATNTLYNPRAMGSVLDREFKNSAEFFQTIWHNANRTADNQAKLHRVRNAFSSTVPSEGGFLIPETLRAEILRISLETSIVRPRARVIPMETLRVPFPAIDSNSNASSVYGGIVAYWTEESAALTASQASFSRIVLEAKKLTAYTEVPNELISDSVGSFEAFLGQILPEAMGFYEDDAYMTGSGVGEPLGVLNAAATGAITVDAEAGQAADTIVWENIVKMYARMLPASLSRAVWIASIDTFPELATMALAVGTGGSAIWLNNGVEGPPMTILGRPVIFTEKASKKGDLGDISFVDFGMYLIGDRQVMSASSSPHYKFGNDLTAYKIVQRVDGRPWVESAITPKNGGDTLSPIVKLAAR